MDACRVAYAPPVAEGQERPRVGSRRWARAAVWLVVLDVAWLAMASTVESLQVLAWLVTVVGLIGLRFSGVPLTRRGRQGLVWCASVTAVMCVVALVEPIFASMPPLAPMSPWVGPLLWLALVMLLSIAAAVVAFDNSMAQIAHEAGVESQVRAWNTIGRWRLGLLVPPTLLIAGGAWSGHPIHLQGSGLLLLLLLVAYVVAVVVIGISWPAVAVLQLARHLWTRGRSAP